MSGIIWGYINKSKNEASEIIGAEMMKKMKQYKIDEFRYITDKNIFMGCGINYNTSESYNEILPYKDNESKLIITADAIIDNREELLEKFNLHDNEVSDFTDSEYILMAYKKWKKNCPKYLVGDFTFVIWDEEKEELFCARDHVGKRTFYYYDDEEVFAFCTVVDPLFKLINKEVNYNERWIADFIALIGVVQISEVSETIYENIYQLQPAHTLIISKMGSMNRCYWNPIEEIKKLKLKSEEQYIGEFLKVYSEAVNCRLRTRKNVGIKLSGGLDSSSVAAIAANTLKKQGKKLKSYTSVPLKGFIDKTPSYVITDESHDVSELAKFISNIDTKFCQCENINSVAYIDFYLDILEQPYKIIENSYWVMEIAKEASKDDCDILLSGQYGNTTVSFGDFFIHEKSLLKEGKIFKAIKEVNCISKKHKVSKKKLIKDIVKMIPSDEYNKKKFYKNNPKYNRFEFCPIKKELIKKWDIEERFDKGDFNLSVAKNYDFNGVKKFIVNNIAFSQMGFFDTKISLAHGILNRDPTRDKRVIEFCLSLPYEIYVKDGVERYLIRKSMEGKIPDSIRMNEKTRGLQGADWLYRLKPIWSSIYIEIKEAIEDEELSKYVNKEYIYSKLDDIEDLSEDVEEGSIRMFLILLILSRFFKRERK